MFLSFNILYNIYKTYSTRENEIKTRRIKAHYIQLRPDTCRPVFIGDNPIHQPDTKLHGTHV